MLFFTGCPYNRYQDILKIFPSHVTNGYKRLRAAANRNEWL
jgi:hypothetical protein